MTPLVSPLSGRPLSQVGPHTLVDGTTERWPVVEGIAYLRAGSVERAQAALGRLDDGDKAGALALLLGENDDWWDEPPPPEVDLRRLVEDADSSCPPTLREAMKRLGWGRVGVYFAHRWSDPTFVAALALSDAHWTAPTSAFELCCGVGHHLRALQEVGVSVVGGDVVFAKLWVAKRWLLQAGAELVCFDAERAPWPVRRRFDLVACHDAFYFLRDKAGVAQRLKALADEGSLLLSHVHNRAWPNLSGAHAMGADELCALFPHALAYDDQELTLAGAERRAPQPRTWSELAEVEAFSIADGAARRSGPEAADGPLSRPPPGAGLVRNPLVSETGVAWPSARYHEEYGARATYGRHHVPPQTVHMGPAVAEAVARRDLLRLPELW